MIAPVERPASPLREDEEAPGDPAVGTRTEPAPLLERTGGVVGEGVLPTPRRPYTSELLELPARVLEDRGRFVTEPLERGVVRLLLLLPTERDELLTPRGAVEPLERTLLPLLWERDAPPMLREELPMLREPLEDDRDVWGGREGIDRWGAERCGEERCGLIERPRLDWLELERLGAEREEPREEPREDWALRD